MGNNSNEAVIAEISRGFNEAVPSSTKKIVLNLRKQPPLWRKIGEALYDIPSSSFVSRDTLINAIGSYLAENDIGYLELAETLRKLEKKGYIEVERSSEENYFLSKEFARAIEVVKIFEEEIVHPIMQKAKNDPKYRNVKDLDLFVASRIYEAIE